MTTNSRLRRAECEITAEITADGMPRIKDYSGIEIHPIKIRYEAYTFDGEFFLTASVFGKDHRNASVDPYDSPYPPMPAWFREVADGLKQQTEATADA